MSGVLVDSDVLIDVLRQRKPDIAQDWRDLAGSNEAVYYSPVSVAEVFHGMREHEREVIERLFSAIICLPIGEEIGRVAGRYLRAFHASHAMALGDALIGASASVYGLTLWTRKRKHFPMKDVRFFRDHLRNAPGASDA
jgi:predicted nucleic acid-binding protein